MKNKVYLYGNNRKNRRIKERNILAGSKKTYIIMVLNVQVVHTIKATLDMPDGILKRIKRAKDISEASAHSTYVTIDTAIITALNNLIVNYENAISSERETAYRKLLAALKSLMATFQTAADLDVDNAEAIVMSGKFGVKKVALKQKGKFTVVNGIDPGTVDLTAQGGGAYSCHDWLFSETGDTFERMPPTVAAKTQKTGLASGKYAYFIHELVTKKGGQGVSQIIKIMVN